MAEKSKESDKKEAERKCKYKYKSEEFKGDQCPHEALPGKDVCYWHEKKDGKDVIKEKGKKFLLLDLREAYLNRANLQMADMGLANLQKSNLSGANLQEADLFETNLQQATLGGANLKEAQLDKANLQKADLIWANLQEVNLVGANLQKANLFLANLQEANLGEANLQEAKMERANLQKADLSVAKLLRADLREADLRDSKFNTYTTLEKINLYQCRLENSTLRFAEKNLFVISNEEKKCINEIEGKYDEAKEVYRNLKNYFRQEGLYDESGQFYYREKSVEKKLHKQQKRWGKWIGNSVYHYLAGYGEQPLWVLVWWAIIILFFGTLYWGLHGLILHGETVTNPIDFYYFSVVTFTTLGFGDIQPNPGMTSIKICAMAEAVLGAFMMALFVLTFGRKMIR